MLAMRFEPYIKTNMTHKPDQMTDKPLAELHKVYRDYVQPSHEDYQTKLEQLTKALVDRWDTPLWKDVPSTAIYINALRNHLERKKEK